MQFVVFCAISQSNAICIVLAKIGCVIGEQQKIVLQVQAKAKWIFLVKVYVNGMGNGRSVIYLVIALVQVVIQGQGGLNAQWVENRDHTEIIV